jgi:hypothetical protein
VAPPEFSVVGSPTPDHLINFIADCELRPF